MAGVGRRRGVRPARAEPVDLSRRATLKRVVVALARARVATPGEALDVNRVLEAGWPGERVLPEAATNRVYVAIATLRKLGLAGVLRTSDEGYLLDHAVPLELA